MLLRLVQRVRSFSSRPGFPARPRKWGWYAAGTTTVGTGVYMTHLLWPDRRAAEDPLHYYSDWKIRLYVSLPLNAISQTTGFFSTLYVPEFMRKPLFGWYARVYSCRMDEAVHSDLKFYKSFAEFFNRPLLPSARPISAGPMVSPADGTILHIGEIENGRVEYVKGHDYEVSEFLGPVDLNLKPGNRLLQVVVYLAPGDYHAFHAPVQWQCDQRTHFPGRLLSVRPSILEKIPILFCLNERTVLNGSWKHGFFSMTAVAATNVGDIAILPSAIDRKGTKLLETEEHEVVSGPAAEYQVGQKVGEFRLGSTIVLIFEASKNASFAVRAGDKVKFGQSILLEE